MKSRWLHVVLLALVLDLLVLRPAAACAASPPERPAGPSLALPAGPAPAPTRAQGHEERGDHAAALFSQAGGGAKAGARPPEVAHGARRSQDPGHRSLHWIPAANRCVVRLRALLRPYSTTLPPPAGA